MRILHTEASTGLGGQELRILREAQGMRQRGHEVILAVAKGGALIPKAREEGFEVHELPNGKKNAVALLWTLLRLIRQHKIELVNTHSSWDAWVGGLAARLSGRYVVRTRHLSTAIRPGINSKLLYRGLADAVVTTCEATAETIRHQAGLGEKVCRSVPTGVDVERLTVAESDVAAFREKYGLQASDVVAGTACVLRSWKGILDLLEAAKRLHDQPNLKWLIVGGGPSLEGFKDVAKQFGIDDRVIFTGHLNNPFPAIASMDIFLLLSTSHEGVSQAVLQAAYLKKPLITTSVGGLGEVCLDGKTGFLVARKSPDEVADKVMALVSDANLRIQMGGCAHQLVLDKFTQGHTLDAMEEVYRSLMA